MKDTSQNHFHHMISVERLCMICGKKVQMALAKNKYPCGNYSNYIFFCFNIDVSHDTGDFRKFYVIKMVLQNEKHTDTLAFL